MRPSTAWGLMWRETRGLGRRFAFFSACLAIGVAAIVCVAGLAANLDRRIRSQARQLLAADLVIRGLRPLPAELVGRLAARSDLRIAHTRELVTVVARQGTAAAPGRSQLVELKVVDEGYPLYGTVEVEPGASLGEVLAGDRVAVAAELLDLLDLDLGDRLEIGGRSLTLAAVVLTEPDRIASPFSLGPRVFMSATAFERTELEQLGSRIVYRTLVALTGASGPTELESTAAELRQLISPGGDYRLETYLDAQEELRDALRRTAGFLGLVALLSLLLGGLGVAQTTRAWLTSRMDDLAILRCLGLGPNELLGLYLAQAALLGIAGSAAGVLLGVALQSLLPHLFPELLGATDLRLWQPLAMLRGLALGIGIALLFSLRSLLIVRRVRPLRVLRRDIEPLPRRRAPNLLTLAVVVAGVCVLASVQAASLAHGVYFVGGLSLTAAVLAAAALLVMRNLAPLARRLRTVWLRHGLLELARPGAATLAAAVSLGLAVVLVVGLYLVDTRLGEELRSELPRDSPTAFLVNIQPAQWPPLAALLADEGAQSVRSVPWVSARLRAIDGREVSQLAEAAGQRDRRWALTREQRLTYLDELPADNRIVAGDLWSRPGIAEVSVEEEFARELGVDLDSRLRFDIQGVPLELTVTSLRSVDWRSFGINFFLVVEPGVLEQAPQQRVAAARLPVDREQRIQDRLARVFPNVTLLRIRELLERIAAVLDYLARGLGFIGAFTVAAGILILAGAVGADSVRRRRQLALLKTLGMTQRTLAAMLAVEFAVVGMIAGAIGAAGSSALSWAVLTHALELDWRLRPVALIAAVAITVALTVSTGVLASRGALGHRPARLLQGE